MTNRLEHKLNQLSPHLLLSLINRAKKFIKTNEVYIKMCKDHGVSTDIIDIIPIKFGHLDVSARTNHSIITLNYKLLENGDFFKSYMYIVHEIEHYLAQSYGDRPTPGADDGDYLKNPAEQDAFIRQIEYIDDIFGPDQADSYTEHLLDHHDKDGEDRNELKEKLMEKVDEE